MHHVYDITSNTFSSRTLYLPAKEPYKFAKVPYISAKMAFPHPVYSAEAVRESLMRLYMSLCVCLYSCVGVYT